MSNSKSGNLVNLIAPLISIDLYEPKIQEDSIVVVFEVLHNYDAAYDLGSFIEKLPEMTLDTEARDTPNSNGNYEVFCEFERNENFPNILMNIITDVQKLANKQDWKVDIYGTDTVLDLSLDILKNHVRLFTETEIKEFFDYSGVQTSILKECISLKNKTLNQDLILEKSSHFIDHDSLYLMIQKHGLVEAPRVKQKMFPAHDVCQFVGTNVFVIERGGKYFIGK